MGFRFRRSFKVAPGVRINVSKSGLSTSIGTRGATVNLRSDRARETVSIPGTGISYTEQQRIEAGGLGTFLLLVLVVVLIVSFFV